MMTKQAVRYIVLQRGGFKAGMLAKMQSRMRKARDRTVSKKTRTDLAVLAGAQALKGVDMDTVLRDLDIGNTGYLCADEVVQLYVLCFGKSVGEARAKELLQSCDVDGDQKITVAELKRTMASYESSGNGCEV